MIKFLVAFSFVLSCPVAFVDDGAEKEQVTLESLRVELIQRTKVDQEARNAITDWTKAHGQSGLLAGGSLSETEKAEFQAIVDKIETIDQENTKWMQQIIDEHGWPTKKLVGAEAANDAWLLVQHADLDPKFQRRCLELMTKLPKDDISQKNIAYLTDRVLLAEGKKQVYGTQFWVVDGQLQPRPLEDPANVDRLRAEMGLESIAEYAETMRKVYGFGSQ